MNDKGHHLTEGGTGRRAASRSLCVGMSINFGFSLAQSMTANSKDHCTALFMATASKRPLGLRRI